MKKQSLPFLFPLTAPTIAQYRSNILKELCLIDAGFANLPISSLQSETLNRMFDLYDRLFFSGFLTDKLPDFCITLSSRMTSSAGKFICIRGPFKRMKHTEIRLSSDFLFRLEKGPFELNGLTVDTPQEAILIVFEHELCHALETVLFGETGIHPDSFPSLTASLDTQRRGTSCLPADKQLPAPD